MARQSHTGAAGRWSRRTTLLGKTTSLPFTLEGDSGVAINPLAGQDTKKSLSAQLHSIWKKKENNLFQFDSRAVILGDRNHFAADTQKN